ncbi:MAG: hypothetical protein AAFX81_09515 [Pseudomonadota bacterium]
MSIQPSRPTSGVWPGGLLALALSMVAVPAAAQTTSSCGDLGVFGTFVTAVTSANPAIESQVAEDACAAYADIALRLAETEAELEVVRNDLIATGAALPPPGSIMLMDDATGCPAGWTDVAVVEPEVFAGRVPVAVGFSADRSIRAFREVGGEEAHRLVTAELPPHDHRLPLAFSSQRDDGPSSAASRLLSGRQIAVATRTGGEATRPTGSGQPHPNMPPFVAIYWCRKD